MNLLDEESGVVIKNIRSGKTSIPKLASDIADMAGTAYAPEQPTFAKALAGGADETTRKIVTKINNSKNYRLRNAATMAVGKAALSANDVMSKLDRFHKKNNDTYYQKPLTPEEKKRKAGKLGYQLMNNSIELANEMISMGIALLESIIYDSE